MKLILEQISLPYRLCFNIFSAHGYDKCGCEIDLGTNLPPVLVSFLPALTEVKFEKEKRDSRRDVVKAKQDLHAKLDSSIANAPFVDRDDLWGPVVVWSSKTWKDFERWLDINDERLRSMLFEPLHYENEKVRVVIYNLPPPVHRKRQVHLQTACHHRCTGMRQVQLRN